MRILVIEDNAANRKFLVDVLDISGYEVIIAEDAHAGITLAREEKPNIILMDIQLPGMNGLDATKILKNDPLTSDIKILAITAMAMKGDKEMCLEAGMDDYVPKPLKADELLTTIERVVQKFSKGQTETS